MTYIYGIHICHGRHIDDVHVWHTYTSHTYMKYNHHELRLASVMLCNHHERGLTSIMLLNHRERALAFIMLCNRRDQGLTPSTEYQWMAKLVCDRSASGCSIIGELLKTTSEWSLTYPNTSQIMCTSLCIVNLEELGCRNDVSQLQPSSCYLIWSVTSWMTSLVMSPTAGFWLAGILFTIVMSFV